MQFFTSLLLFSLAAPAVLSHPSPENDSKALPKLAAGLPTDSQSPPSLDDVPLVGKLLSGLGLDPKSKDPVSMAHGIIEPAFESMAKAASALPGDGPTIAKMLRKTKELVHQRIDTHSKSPERRSKSSNAASIVPRQGVTVNVDDELEDVDTEEIDEDSDVGTILAQGVRAGCKCLSVILYLTVHLMRALLDLLLGALIEGLQPLGSLGEVLTDLLSDLQAILHESLSSVAEDLTPENLCGDI